MKKIVFVLAVASLALATCDGSGTSNAEKHYEPVAEQWLSVQVPLVTESDLPSR